MNFFSLNKKLKRFQKKRLKTLNVFQKMIDRLIKMNEKLIVMEDKAQERIENEYQRYLEKKAEYEEGMKEAATQRKANMNNINKLRGYVDGE